MVWSTTEGPSRKRILKRPDRVVLRMPDLIESPSSNNFNRDRPFRFVYNITYTSRIAMLRVPMCSLRVYPHSMPCGLR